MDMYNLLIEDHNKVKALFEKALADKDNIDKETVEKICDELLLHMEKEEKFLYPLLLKIEEVEDMSKEAIEEHRGAKETIRALKHKELNKAEYTVKVETLKLEIEHHVKEEEEELFPKLKKLIAKEQTNDIANEMGKLHQPASEKMLIKQ